MPKTIYLLDPETGDLVGETDHPHDPVETERTGKTFYALLNPSHATSIKPPKVPAGKKARLVNDKWTLVALLREPEPEIPPAPVEPVAPAPPTFEVRQAALREHVQDYLDAMARALGYDDIKAAVTYAEEPAVARFQNEGRALRAWRSLVWVACYELLDRIRKDEALEPTKEALIGLLPTFAMPAPPSEIAPSPDATSASTKPAT